MMNSTIFSLFLILNSCVFAQIGVLESLISIETNYRIYHPDTWNIDDHEHYIVHWENGIIGLIDLPIRKSNDTIFRQLMRFDKQGRVTLRVQNYFTSIIESDSNTLYGITGDVESYYLNSLIRTSYHTTNGHVDQNGVKLFDRNGQIIEVCYYDKSNVPKTGLFIEKLKSGIYLIRRLDQGKQLFSILIDINRRNSLIEYSGSNIPSKREIKKIIERHSLGKKDQLILPYN